MSYPKWRHHPEKESRIVNDMAEEGLFCPSGEGWADYRELPSEDTSEVLVSDEPPADEVPE